MGHQNDRKETYSLENKNGRWRKFSIEDIEDKGYTLDLKWMKIDDGTDNLSINDLLIELKEKSNNISNAVRELEKILKEVENNGN